MTLYYCHNSFDSSDQNAPNIRMTREELLAEYYEWWKEKMIKVGKQDMISEDNCIEDWLVINFGWTEEI